tara:strand:+ start:7 stop:624 length:618 start_codon:yes stop_codon:yes gene_type:complete
MDLINRAKKLRAIQAIQEDMNNLGKTPVVQALQRDLGNVGASTRGLVSDVAGDLRRGSEQKMDQVRQREMTRDLIRGNKGAQNVVAETLANADAELFGTVAGQSAKDAYMKQLQAEGLSNLAAGKFARGYVQNTERPQATPRARIQQMLGAIENNPGTAIAAGAGTGAVGGVALITASGQALADLGNFLAGGQQNQDQRDNVLRS